jgi:hypothetical protein
MKVINKIKENAEQNTKRIKGNQRRINIKVNKEVLKELRSNEHIHCNFELDHLKINSSINAAYNYNNDIIINKN